MTMPVSEQVTITAEHGTICSDWPVYRDPCTLTLMKTDAAHWSQITPIARIRIDVGRIVEIEEVYNG
ncbi:hypothetical protein ACFXHA_38515 [Nocardia sp. NPDC059240]|uniref:hypothetical protein n=1 Tax=Nocardia sp. NPDC059240 TaxID=3346786 RepID=UPI00367E45C8